MDNNITYEALSHSKWECKYHVVFVPKKRKKQLYGAVRRFLGKVFHELARQRGSKIIKWNKIMHIFDIDAAEMFSSKAVWK